MTNKSIRFFNDREARAVWDDENNCRWLSATDAVRAINDESRTIQKPKSSVTSKFMLKFIPC